jgi:predicted Kef-type K+ transport protein
MKRAIGSILCFAAIMLIVGQTLKPTADTSAHKAQMWAVIGLMLAIGVPLSAAKKSSDLKK